MYSRENKLLQLSRYGKFGEQHYRCQFKEVPFVKIMKEAKFKMVLRFGDDVRL